MCHNIACSMRGAESLLSYVERRLGINGKGQIEEYGVAAFNQLFAGWRSYVTCRQSIGRIAETVGPAESELIVQVARSARLGP